MARVVSLIGITHNPLLPKLFGRADRPPGCVKLIERIEKFRSELSRAEPDVLVMIGNDHLHQFFMDNMPAFLIGKMDAYDGTFYDEIREFGLPTCRVPGDAQSSDAIMEGAFERGVDFAYSNELTMDHSIVVPLMFVRPQMDLPIVPILTNCIAPPLPRAKRFYEVGEALRDVIDRLDSRKRVAVIVSGHLSLEVGGPKQFEARLTDPRFDERAVGWVARGDVRGAVDSCSFEELSKSGNMTPGFLNFVMLMGLAKAAPPSFAEGVDAGLPATPFFAWGEQGVAS
jgi:protocatechuate 4,5-dioxygenase beta chain